MHPVPHVGQTSTQRGKQFVTHFVNRDLPRPCHLVTQTSTQRGKQGNTSVENVFSHVFYAA